MAQRAMRKQKIYRLYFGTFICHEIKSVSAKVDPSLKPTFHPSPYMSSLRIWGGVSGFCSPPPAPLPSAQYDNTIRAKFPDCHRVDRVSGFLRIYVLFHLKVTKFFVYSSYDLALANYLLKMTTVAASVVTNNNYCLLKKKQRLY